MEQTDRRPRGNGKFRPARFASVIVQELAQQIISGALAEGDILPTEPALCDEFGFSRTVVREGLKLLEERGLVRVIHRHGGATAPLAAGASKATLKRTAAEHRAILEALAEGNGELAGERISEHIEARWSERKSRRKGT